MAFCDIQNKCLFFLTALKHSLVILALMNCPQSSLPLPMTFFNKTELQKFPEWGFPGGAVVESPPANAGDTGSCPSPGGSHMPRSGWAREPWPLSLRVRSLCSATGEVTTVRGPHTAKKKNSLSMSRCSQYFLCTLSPL